MQTKEQRCESERKHRLKKLHYIRSWKSERGCLCGENDPIVLDAHHRDPETKHKSLKQGTAGLYRLSWAALEEELTKCDVICANCHRRLTHMERKHG